MSRLVTFGCSITYGEGLDDCWVNNNAGPEPSKYVWPQLLATELNLECINLGVPGTSNKQICYDILSTSFKKTDLVVIMWTYFSRTCFFQDKTGSQFGDSQQSKRIMIQDVSNKNLNRKRQKYNTTYYRNFYTETNSNIENYMYINWSKSMLDKKGIRNYHITCNKPQPLSQLVPTTSSLLEAPQWNCVSLDNINSCLIDLALDRTHPGIKSHKNIYKKLKLDIQRSQQ